MLCIVHVAILFFVSCTNACYSDNNTCLLLRYDSFDCRKFILLAIPILGCCDVWS